VEERLAAARPNALAGVFLMVLAVFAAVFHSLFVRKLAAHYNTFTIVTYQSTFGFANRKFVKKLWGV
jgi:drug/metabolite transporter (DMT)-like permease